MKIAFYKAYGTGWLNKAISWVMKVWTRGPYTHVELVKTNDSKAPMNWEWFSAAAREDEVRAKSIKYKCHHWDVFDIVGGDKEAAFKFILSQCGKEYDWKGIFLTQIVPLSRHSGDKWFCSEIVRKGLCEGGVLPCDDNHHQYDPNELFKELQQMGKLTNG